MGFIPSFAGYVDLKEFGEFGVFIIPSDSIVIINKELLVQDVLMLTLEEHIFLRLQTHSDS